MPGLRRGHPRAPPAKPGSAPNPARVGGDAGAHRLHCNRRARGWSSRGVVEAERRVHDDEVLAGELADARRLDDGGANPQGLQLFAELTADAMGRIMAALDDDLNTPAALSVLAELAKAGNESLDLAQKRKKHTEVQRAAPFVAAKLQAMMLAGLKMLGLLQTPPDVYPYRTQKPGGSKIAGLSPEQVEARLAERAAARRTAICSGATPSAPSSRPGGLRLPIRRRAPWRAAAR